MFLSPAAPSLSNALVLGSRLLGGGWGGGGGGFAKEEWKKMHYGRVKEIKTGINFQFNHQLAFMMSGSGLALVFAKKFCCRFFFPKPIEL
jgi:uncharacterized membrane protein YgdD (TMEM256/DUF423 family)